MAVLYCLTVLSVETTLSVQDSSWGDAVNLQHPELAWKIWGFLCCGVAVAHRGGSYLGSEFCVWKNMMVAVGASAW